VQRAHRRSAGRRASSRQHRCKRQFACSGEMAVARSANAIFFRPGLSQQIPGLVRPQEVEINPVVGVYGTPMRGDSGSILRGDCLRAVEINPSVSRDGFYPQTSSKRWVPALATVGAKDCFRQANPKSLGCTSSRTSWLVAALSPAASKSHKGECGRSAHARDRLDFRGLVGAAR
jgi:hypothetical protein